MVIYLSRNALEKVAVCNDIYPNLHAIFKSHAILCVDMTDEELDIALADTEGNISQFCLRNEIETYALHPYFCSLKEDQSQIVLKSRSMFLLDISSDEAKELTEKYGIIVQSENCIDDEVFQLSFRRVLEKDTTIPGASHGWRNLFKELRFPPCNSFVITDNYLFKNVKNGQPVGQENLKMLLDALLPAKLETTFHLFIVAQKSNRVFNDEKAKEVLVELTNYINEIRSDIKVQLELVTSHTVHPRKIISNYFVIVCDKGFQLFHPIRKNEICENNEICATSILYDASNTSGDTLLTISAKDIDSIRKVCKECKVLRQQIVNCVDDPTKMIIGDCSEDKTIKNRLIN